MLFRSTLSPRRAVGRWRSQCLQHFPHRSQSRLVLLNFPACQKVSCLPVRVITGVFRQATLPLRSPHLLGLGFCGVLPAVPAQAFQFRAPLRNETILTVPADEWRATLVRSFLPWHSASLRARCRNPSPHHRAYDRCANSELLPPSGHPPPATQMPW